MKRDKETRNKLLASAREEFLEKGYNNASLRSICKKAGVTTGALYFFFENKEDLFDALTKDAVDALLFLLQKHMEDEIRMAKEGMLSVEPKEDFQEHYDLSHMAIHQMYLRRDDFLLVLTKSQGTKLEGVVDRFIELMEQHFRSVADEMQKLYPATCIPDTLIHWVAHMQIDAFVHMITHIENEAEAIVYMEKVMAYMIKGWYGMFESKD